MNSNFSRSKPASLLAILLALTIIVSLLPLRPSAAAAPAPQTPDWAQRAPVTTITVNSGTDPDDSQSKTCTANPTTCTLRRAIVEAKGLSAAQLPVLIQFNIPADTANNYNAALGIWKIPLFATTQLSALPRLDGQVTIDGSTQPGGSTIGPKIFLVGPGTGSKDGLVVGDSGADNEIVIRGIAFQNFKTHMYVNSSQNLIEQNWFGLSDDGTDIYLRAAGVQDGSGNSAIAFAGSPSNNLVQNNVFVGLDGVSVALLGNANTVADNYFGTIYDGTVPDKQTDPALICTPADWLGGGGISMAGTNHIVRDNIFAGLRQHISSTALQPEAIRVSGSSGHTIQDNMIGIDAADSIIGVCGRGIYLADGPKSLTVTGNWIVNPGYSAISLNGALYDANTLRSNIIWNVNGWPELDNMSQAEDAIQVGKSLPLAFREFQPAAITLVNGVNVSGTSGAGSLCKSCEIEIFLDDTDEIAEALESLAVVTADANGNWSATLPYELGLGQALRTTTTTHQYNDIAGMSAGTTTGLSTLYMPAHWVFLPTMVRK